MSERYAKPVQCEHEWEVMSPCPECGYEVAGRAVQDDGLQRAAENVIRWWDAAPPAFPEGEHIGPAIEGLRVALRAAPALQTPSQSSDPR